MSCCDNVVGRFVQTAAEHHGTDSCAVRSRTGSLDQWTKRWPNGQLAVRETEFSRALAPVADALCKEMEDARTHIAEALVRSDSCPVMLTS